MGKFASAKKVLICGAGIGGLTAAIAMARRGLEVAIVEQAQELRELGAGLQLSPNAMHVMARLGLIADISAVAFEPESSVIRHYRSGRAYLELPLKARCQSRYGAPYYQIHRADLQRILLRAAQEAGVEIALGESATGFTQSDTQVRLETAKTTRVADVLIGADGIRSVIRDGLFGAQSPRFTGQVAWRGVVPTNALPPDLIAPKTTVWVGPQHHFVTYYLKAGAMVNFVAVEERSDWTKTGWNEPGRIDQLQEAFEDWHPEITALLDATSQSYLWALFDRDPLAAWSFGNVALLGDAAHPMLPFMAQGAAMAIEDGWVLAQCLGQYPPQQALLSFEAARKSRTTMLQKISRKNAKLFHRNGGLGDLWQRSKLNIAGLWPQTATQRLDKIYGVNVTRP